jgi:hypothetical protein
VSLSYVAVLTLLHSPSFGNGVSYLKHSKKISITKTKEPREKNFYFYKKKRKEKVIKL